jgi:hypothetical protein
MLQSLVLIVASVLWLSSTSLASVLIQDNFLRTGQNESLTAPLTQFGGVTTTQKWSGLIEVILSGEAVENPPTGLHVDPFWAFSPGNPDIVQGTGHRFRISFTGCAASFECGAPDIVLFMRFVDGVGFVSPPNVSTLDPIPLSTVIPILQSIVPYTTSHTYRFVIDIGSTPQFLTLGDGDGGVSDNSGQFNIQLFSVVQGVPFQNFSGSLDAKLNAAANDDQFRVNAAFVLGESSNGINPVTEKVIIRVGSVSKTIPPLSFIKNKQGFTFDGVVDGTSIKATIMPQKNGYMLDATVVGTNFDGSEFPLPLGLTVGDDGGTTLLTNAKLTAQSQ